MLNDGRNSSSNNEETFPQLRNFKNQSWIQVQLGSLHIFLVKASKSTHFSWNWEPLFPPLDNFAFHPTRLNMSLPNPIWTILMKSFIFTFQGLLQNQSIFQNHFFYRNMLLSFPSKLASEQRIKFTEELTETWWKSNERIMNKPKE